jgi:hypothetical protein
MLQASVLDRLFENFGLDHSPSYILLSTSLNFSMPYQSLQLQLAPMVDSSACINSQRSNYFRSPPTCFLMRAVETDGEHYWNREGG